MLSYLTLPSGDVMKPIPCQTITRIFYKFYRMQSHQGFQRITDDVIHIIMLRKIINITI